LAGFCRQAFIFTLADCPATIFMVMAGKIIINCQRCKGCGLCVVVCPRKCLRISENSNKNGYFPAEFSDGDCSGCTMCALICPEAVIEVQIDEPAEIKEIDNKKKNNTSAKQKAKGLSLK